MNQVSLKQQVPIMNAMIRNLQKKFFSWGIRKTGYDPERNIRGSTAPLWINPSPGFYKLFFILCLISCFQLIGNISFVQVYQIITSAYNSAKALENEIANNSTNSSVPVIPSNNSTNVTNNDTLCLQEIESSLDPIMIILGFIIVFVNSLYAYFLLNIEYASDEEWTRYTFIKIGFWIALSIYIVLVCLNCQTLYVYYEKGIIAPTGIFTRVGVSSCKTLYLVNMISTVIVAGNCLFLNIFQLINALSNLRKMFLPLEGEDLTARSEDPDLIIL